MFTFNVLKSCTQANKLNEKIKKIKLILMHYRSKAAYKIERISYKIQTQSENLMSL